MERPTTDAGAEADDTKEVRTETAAHEKAERIAAAWSSRTATTIGTSRAPTTVAIAAMIIVEASVTDVGQEWLPQITGRIEAVARRTEAGRDRLESGE
jgi:hypothetical protein